MSISALGSTLGWYCRSSLISGLMWKQPCDDKPSRVLTSVYLMNGCRAEVKPVHAVSVGSDRRPVTAPVKELVKTASNMSKQLSPADVSGAAEEWETASEGSDGGLHQRRQTTHRDDSGRSLPVKSVGDQQSTQHSPCSSGPTSLAAISDLERSWNEAAMFDVGNSATQHNLSMSGSLTTNTDSGYQSTTSSQAPASRLFTVSFSSPSIREALNRFDSRLSLLTL